MDGRSLCCTDLQALLEYFCATRRGEPALSRVQSTPAREREREARLQVDLLKLVGGLFPCADDESRSQTLAACSNALAHGYNPLREPSAPLAQASPSLTQPRTPRRPRHLRSTSSGSPTCRPALQLARSSRRGAARRTMATRAGPGRASRRRERELGRRRCARAGAARSSGRSRGGRTMMRPREEGGGSR